MKHPDPKRFVKIMECRDCGTRYPVVPHWPGSAPHGPQRCTSRDWVEVKAPIDHVGRFTDVDQDWRDWPPEES